MPISAQDLARAGTVAIAAYKRNPPVDQVTHKHPMLDTLLEKKQDAPSSFDGLITQIRTSNTTGLAGSGIYAGDDTVAYGRIDSVAKARYTYVNVHDGFQLTEDDLKMAGISMIDRNMADSINAGASATADERVALTNLMKEQTTVLDESMRQRIVRILLLDGTQATGAPAGLDALVSLNPTVGTIGGIDRSTKTYWRNYVKTGLVAGTYGSGGNMIEEMEKAWRNCRRIGGQSPTHIRVGESFYDALRQYYKLNVTSGVAEQNYITMRIGTEDILFHGVKVEIDWDFVDMDTLQAPTIPWAKRCYFLNLNRIKLRPVKGQWMQERTPARPANQYVTQWAVTCSFYIEMEQANCHAVLALA